MAYSKQEEVLLTYDKILQTVVDLDLRFTQSEMYEELRDRVNMSGLAQELADKILDVVDFIEKNGATSD